MRRTSETNRLTRRLRKCKVLASCARVEERVGTGGCATSPALAAGCICLPLPSVTRALIYSHWPQGTLRATRVWRRSPGQ